MSRHRSRGHQGKRQKPLKQAYLSSGCAHQQPIRSSSGSRPLATTNTFTESITTITTTTTPQQSPIMIRKPVPTRTYDECVRRRAARNPHLRHKVREMRLRLCPLVQLNTGRVHPDFPRTVLHFWLLTDAQLEDLAQFYHQRDPCAWTLCYPCPIAWRSDLPVEEKRRKIGKFIGLRGCESPVIMLKTEEEIAAEGRAARQENEEEMWQRKLGHWGS